MSEIEKLNKIIDELREQKAELQDYYKKMSLSYVDAVFKIDELNNLNENFAKENTELLHQNNVLKINYNDLIQRVKPQI